MHAFNDINIRDNRPKSRVKNIVSLVLTKTKKKKKMLRNRTDFTDFAYFLSPLQITPSIISLLIRTRTKFCEKIVVLIRPQSVRGENICYTGERTSTWKNPSTVSVRKIV